MTEVVLYSNYLLRATLGENNVVGSCRRVARSVVAWSVGTLMDVGFNVVSHTDNPEILHYGR